MVIKINLPIWDRALKHSLLAALFAVGTVFSAANAAEGTRPAPEQPELGEALRSGDIANAFRLARDKAEKGDIDSQYNVSLFFWHGVGAPQNFEEAIRWSTLSAIRGHRKATAARNLMLRTVEPQLVQKGMEWSRQRLIKLAEGGDDDALSPLAVSYRSDFGFPNDAEAYFWSSLAVSMGKVEVRRQRDSLVQTMKQADLVKAQQRAAEWTGKWRKDRS